MTNKNEKRSTEAIQNFINTVFTEEEILKELEFLCANNKELGKKHIDLINSKNFDITKKIIVHSNLLKVVLKDDFEDKLLLRLYQKK